MYGGVGGYGNINGTIYRSEDAGDNWTQTSLEMGSYGKVTDILISPENQEFVYVATTQEGVYFSMDDGVIGSSNDGLPASYISV